MPETDENAVFLNYVYQFNQGDQLNEALRLSLEAINELDITKSKIT